MHDGLKAFQEREGLDPDGWIRPGGPTERTLNAALFEQSDDSGDGLAGTRVSASVGSGGANRPDDVKRAKSALGGLGLYPAPGPRARTMTPRTTRISPSLSAPSSADTGCR
ncbi:hypothetical protein [Minwuia sp.]|uniref:hypothetical protein n=1 Tax=Minwuia sp. TaxID=2493630 RepID=UPI003A93D37F